LNPYLFELVNIREQASWVHMNEPEAATEKAIELIKMNIAKARELGPSRRSRSRPPSPCSSLEAALRACSPRKTLPTRTSTYISWKRGYTWRGDEEVQP